MSVPHTVFIIPYRNRPLEKEGLDIFLNKLRTDRNWSEDEMKVYYINQLDNKRFNRGAMKNLGFLYTKNHYPEDYKNMTFIFHDVDFHPKSTTLLSYSAEIGKIEHYYGFDFVLGGVFSIKGADFEKTGGFPNFWGWGLEDNVMYQRALDNDIVVDRSNFFKIYDKNFVYINEEGDRRNNLKTISRREYYIAKIEDKETFNDLKEISSYTVDNVVNITNFVTGRNYQDSEFVVEDLEKTRGQIISRPGYFRRQWSLAV